MVISLALLTAAATAAAAAATTGFEFATSEAGSKSWNISCHQENNNTLRNWTYTSCIRSIFHREHQCSSLQWSSHQHVQRAHARTTKVKAAEEHTFSILALVFWVSVRPRTWRASASFMKVWRRVWDTLTWPSYMKASTASRSSMGTSLRMITGCGHGLFWWWWHGVLEGLFKKELVLRITHLPENWEMTKSDPSLNLCYCTIFNE